MNIRGPLRYLATFALVGISGVASAENDGTASARLFSDRASRQLMAYSPVSVQLLPSPVVEADGAPTTKAEQSAFPAKANRTSAELCENAVLSRDAIRDLVIAEAKRQNVDTKLALAVAAEESDYGMNVNSKAGARGVMQLMPATASAYGVASICEPKENIAGGVSFLKDLMQRYDGNVLLVVAAYNAGEERILRSRGIPAIPETVNYTAKVINRYYEFDNVLTRSTKNASAQSIERSQSSAIISTHATGRQSLEWIGGSVLFVN